MSSHLSSYEWCELMEILLILIPPPDRLGSWPWHWHPQHWLGWQTGSQRWTQSHRRLGRSSHLRGWRVCDPGTFLYKKTEEPIPDPLPPPGFFEHKMCVVFYISTDQISIPWLWPKAPKCCLESWPVLSPQGRCDKGLKQSWVMSILEETSIHYPWRKCWVWTISYWFVRN